LVSGKVGGIGRFGFGGLGLGSSLGPRGFDLLKLPEVRVTVRTRHLVPAFNPSKDSLFPTLLHVIKYVLSCERDKKKELSLNEIYKSHVQCVHKCTV
jgi:hypothetical protein